MATNTSTRRLALRQVSEGAVSDGAWWPESRSLGSEIAHLVALWPSETARIVRVLYSPPDWDDHPRSVPIEGGRIKTGSFPRDDTHRLTLSLVDGHRRSITVIPPTTPSREASQVLDGVCKGADLHWTAHPEDQVGWDDEAGHLPA
jgi:hypothetical protein